MIARGRDLFEECEGRRSKGPGARYKLGGRDIIDVLAIAVDDAASFLRRGRGEERGAHAILGRLADSASSTYSLGQPLPPVRRRASSAPSFAPTVRQGGVPYILDEPNRRPALADVRELPPAYDARRPGKFVHRHRAPPFGHGAADWISDLGLRALAHDGRTGRLRWHAPGPRFAAPPPSPASTSAAYRWAPDAAASTLRPAGSGPVSKGSRTRSRRPLQRLGTVRAQPARTCQRHARPV